MIVSAKPDNGSGHNNGFVCYDERGNRVNSQYGLWDKVVSAVVNGDKLIVTTTTTVIYFRISGNHFTRYNSHSV